MLTTLPSAFLQAEQQLQAVGETAHAGRFRGLRMRFDLPGLHVVVFGEFNRGKSTLINALLGRIVLPTKLIPTTGHVTRLLFAADEMVTVRFLDGRTEQHGFEQISNFTTLDTEGAARPDVESVEVGVNSSLLRSGLLLIDTPGVNDREAQTRRARNAIDRADLVLFVLDARQLLGDSERELAVDWLCNDLGKAVVPVVNFMNSLEEGDQRLVRQRLNRWCTQLGSCLGRSWFEVNALGALRYALGNGPPPSDDFAALQTALRLCRGEQRRLLQQQARLGQLRHQVRSVQRENADLLRRLRSDIVRVARQREALRNKLQTLQYRFEAAARLLKSRVLTAADGVLESKLQRLTNFWFANESKERLQNNALRWYQDQLTTAVREIEKIGHTELVALAGDQLGRPEPLTISEQMILESRLAVGDLPSIDPPGAVVGWGASLGAFVGTMALPGIGTAFGAVLGGWLARTMGSREPDYPAAYSAKATEHWAEDALGVTKRLKAQVIARVDEMRGVLAEQLAQARGGPIPAEVARRETLDKTLIRCETELRSVGRRNE